MELLLPGGRVINIVSVTASEKRVTLDQMTTAELWLKQLYAGGARYIVHGDCIVGDEKLHHLAFDLGYKAIIFPSNVPGKRAFCGPAVHIHPPEHPLKRNPKIVGAGDCLLVFPTEEREITRSGVWMTKRCAERLGKPFMVCYPSGIRRP